MPYALGKAPATPDDRDLRAAAYVTPLTLIPPDVDTGNLHLVEDWGMLGNDNYGDCVFAGGDHETMLWLQESDHDVAGLFDDDTALGDYAAVTGFSPSDPDSDKGTNVRDALRYRRHTGLADTAGTRHTIHGFMRLIAGNHYELKMAVHVFDATGVGIRFPESAHAQFDAGEPWDVVPGTPEPKDGHYIPAIGYDADYVYCVTWGKLQPMTWAFFDTYCDEAWSIFSQESLKRGESIDGLDAQQLSADLNALGA